MLKNEKTAAYWEEWIASAISKETNTPSTSLDIDKPFADFALDSLVTVTLAADLEEAWGRHVDPTIFWEFPDIKSLAAWIAAQ